MIQAIGMIVEGAGNIMRGIGDIVASGEQTKQKKEETKQIEDSNRTAARIAQLQIDLQATADAGQRRILETQIKQLKLQYEAELAKMEAENSFTGNKLLIFGGVAVIILIFGVVFIKDEK